MDLRKTLQGGRKSPITFDMIGDWDSVQNNLNLLPHELKVSGMQGQRKVAETFAKNVKKNIETERFNLVPKKYNSSDGRALINDENYIRNIKAWRANYIYYAGVKAGIQEPKSKIEIAHLAAIHEHGNPGRNLPARPVWGPTYNELGGRRGAKK